MAMNDEETVALIAGGHTLGKTHGAADPDAYVGRGPEGAPIQEMGPPGLEELLQVREGRGRGKVSRHFLENPDALGDACARAWFKLTHRDMGPIERYLGPE